jgi:CHAT domain-containing protein
MRMPGQSGPYRRRLAAAVLSAGLLAGWGLAAGSAAAQGSVREALRILDGFRDPQPAAAGTAAAAPATAPLAPPPRSISDITAILEAQKPDPARLAAARAAADAAAPAGATPAELMEFHFNRSLAANALGRAQQQLEDARRAVEIARTLDLPLPRLNVIMQQLGFAYQGIGDFGAAIAAQDDRLKAMSAGPMGRFQYFSIYHTKIIYATRAGRLDLAREAMLALDQLHKEVPSWTFLPPATRDIFTALTMRARGNIALVTGRYGEAETALREANRLLITSVLPNQAAINQAPGLVENLRDLTYIDTARALSGQNREIEAEAEVRRSLLHRLERHGRYSVEVAGDLYDLSRVLYAQGRIADAETLAAAGRDILETIGHGAGSIYLAANLFQLARTQMALERIDAAGATFAALQLVTGDNTDLRLQFLDRNPDYGLLLMRTGQMDLAARIFEANVADLQARLGDRALATAQARGWLGISLLRRGDAARAQQEFAAAMPVLLTGGGGADDDDGGATVAERDRQNRQIVEAYMGLLAETGDAAAAAESFRLSDMIRGRAVQRALAASAARAAVTDPELARLARYEQDAQKQAAAFLRLLTDALMQPSRDQDPKALQRLRQDIDLLRGARARIRAEIERRFPDYANLVDPRPATLQQARASLRPGEALIATYLGADRVFVWAVPQEGAPAFAAAPMGEAEIAALIGRLRQALDPNAASLDDVPAFDTGIAHRLYSLLLAPVAAGWSQAASLFFVPHAALGQLPMSLLVTDTVSTPAKGAVAFAEYRAIPFLARKAAVTQLPSVSALVTLRALPPPPADRAALIAFADPWFNAAQASAAKAEAGVAALQTRGRALVRRNSPRDGGTGAADFAALPRLPDTADEVLGIATALRADPARDLFLGAAANEKTVRGSDLSRRRVVMFATHGLVPGDLDGLGQPALALSAPAVAGVDGDGLLTMDEILSLRLNADWVVLSACNTATGSAAGAESLSGLGRAFFYAGTRALLVSNWPVETVSARALTTDLFRRQAEDAGLARSEALRQAMLALIDGAGAVDPQTGQSIFSYAHPIFWAPFSVVGDGG